jgi:hypothetical protein
MILLQVDLNRFWEEPNDSCVKLMDVSFNPDTGQMKQVVPCDFRVNPLKKTQALTSRINTI